MLLLHSLKTLSFCDTENEIMIKNPGHSHLFLRKSVLFHPTTATNNVRQSSSMVFAKNIISLVNIFLCHVGVLWDHRLFTPKMTLANHEILACHLIPLHNAIVSSIIAPFHFQKTIASYVIGIKLSPVYWALSEV